MILGITVSMTMVRLRYLLVASAALLGAPGPAASAEPDGLGLVTDTWARYRSVKTEREESEILIVSAPQAAAIPARRPKRWRARRAPA